MPRELNLEEAKILKMEDDFYVRLETNGLLRVEKADTYNYTTSSRKFPADADFVQELNSAYEIAVQGLNPPPRIMGRGR